MLQIRHIVFILILSTLWSISTFYCPGVQADIDDPEVARVLDHVLKVYLKPNGIDSLERLTPEELVIWMGFAVGRQHLHIPGSPERLQRYRYLDERCTEAVKEYAESIYQMRISERLPVPLDRDAFIAEFVQYYQAGFSGLATEQIKSRFTIPDNFPVLIGGPPPGSGPAEDVTDLEGRYFARSLDGSHEVSVVLYSEEIQGGFHGMSSGNRVFTHWKVTPNELIFYDGALRETARWRLVRPRVMRATVTNHYTNTRMEYELWRKGSDPFHVEMAQNQTVTTTAADLPTSQTDMTIDLLSPANYAGEYYARNLSDSDAPEKRYQLSDARVDGEYYGMTSVGLLHPYWKLDGQELVFYDRQKREVFRWQQEGRNVMRDVVRNPQTGENEIWSLRRTKPAGLPVLATNTLVDARVRADSSLDENQTEAEDSQVEAEELLVSELDRLPGAVEQTVERLIKAVKNRDVETVDFLVTGRAQKIYAEHLRPAMLKSRRDFTTRERAIDSLLSSLGHSMEVGRIDAKRGTVLVNLTVDLGLFSSFDRNIVSLRYEEGRWKVEDLRENREILDMLEILTGS